MANISITFEGIDQAIANLNYRQNSVKQKAILAIRAFYTSEESIKQLDSIDTDILIKSIWDVGGNLSRIKTKRRNFSSIKSSINADLEKLSKKEQNPENIIISDSNVFDMTQEAKNNLLSSFSDAVKTGDIDINQAADLLKTVADFLGDYQPEDTDTDPGDIVNQIKNILNKITKGTLFDEDKGRGEGFEEVDIEDDIEEIELDEDEELEEVDGLGEDETLDGIDSPEIDRPGEDEILEEVDELDEDVEGIELDDDEELEEIDENIEEVEIDEDEELEEVDTLDENSEKVDIEDDIEEIELDEDEELEEVDGLGEDETLDGIDSPEIGSPGGDEILEKIDELDEDVEEIELDEDEELEEIDENIEEIEIDEDEELEEVDTLDENSEEVDIEEIELDEDEELEKVDELDEDELKALEEFREKKELAEHFDETLGEREKKYNKYVVVPEGKYTIGTKKSLKSSLELQQFDMPEVYISIYPVTNSLFEIFIEETGYVTTAEKLGYGRVYSSRFKKDTMGSTWNNSAGAEDIKGACWHMPSGPGSSLHEKRNHPVVQVSVDDASAFTSWIGRRIPTEAEWESAARTDMGYKYPWGNEFNPKAINIEQSGLSDTSAVDEFDTFANEFKIIDMLGNVLEWTSDLENPPIKSKKTVKYCVAKGAAWNTNDDATISSRALFKPGFTSNTIGFRCISEIFL